MRINECIVVLAFLIFRKGLQNWSVESSSSSWVPTHPQNSSLNRQAPSTRAITLLATVAGSVGPALFLQDAYRRLPVLYKVEGCRLPGAYADSVRVGTRGRREPSAGIDWRYSSPPDANTRKRKQTPSASPESPVIIPLMTDIDVCVFYWCLSFFKFINPIGASDRGFRVDPGCIEFKPEDHPIHNTLLREGPPSWLQSLALPAPTYPCRTPTANAGLALVPASGGS